jgi:hypothetical protein
MNVVILVAFRLRSKLRRTAGALAQAVVKAVGAVMLDSSRISGWRIRRRQHLYSPPSINRVSAGTRPSSRA